MYFTHLRSLKAKSKSSLLSRVSNHFSNFLNVRAVRAPFRSELKMLLTEIELKSSKIQRKSSTANGSFNYKCIDFQGNFFERL